MANLLRMGHCAPCIMQTMLDVSNKHAEWLVKLTAGLPGGIGNTGGECGGITAPLVLLGLRYGRHAMYEGLPVVVYKGQGLLQRFKHCTGSTLCKEIRRDGHLPLACIGAIRQSPGIWAQTLSTDCSDVIPSERREAYRLLYAHFAEKGFHCAHAVLHQLRHTMSVSDELLDATSAFVGGTVFSGMTCSAFTAGVMAIGATLGEVENSRLRVLRMLATMAAGGDAFADDLNAFSRVMNLGHELSEWFTGAFGCTQCHAITHCDFSTVKGVTQYIESDSVGGCMAIAREVAAKVQDIIERGD